MRCLPSRHFPSWLPGVYRAPNHGEEVDGNGSVIFRFENGLGVAALPQALRQSSSPSFVEGWSLRNARKLSSPRKLGTGLPSA
jgi:hypothetical protein